MAFQREAPAAIGAKATRIIESALAPRSRGTRRFRVIHDIKFAGYRIELHGTNEGANVFTRNGHNWTKRFKKIAGDVRF